MRAWADGSTRLRSASLPLRVTLTGFLLFVAIGEATGIVIDARHTGFSPTGIARHYLGHEPDLQFPKELPVLLENTHFHVFIVPIVLLILTHVLFLTDRSERTKLTLTVVAYASALVELAAPWAVRYGGSPFAWLKLGGALVFHATLVLLIAVPLWEAWLPPGPRPAQSKA